MPASPPITPLFADVLQGNARAGARLMTLAENNRADAVPLLKALFPPHRQGACHRHHRPTGIRQEHPHRSAHRRTAPTRKTVGIIAIDPSSPFSGGAILGDRVRMQGHSLDDGVFIRSMATRGHLGGLSRSTHDVIDILDAMGKDYVLVETVGVGQDEVDVVRTAHTTLVVATPGSGDEIQVIKAGVMEIGDLFVVNKADRDGADRTVTDIEMMLHMAGPDHGWMPPVLRTTAIHGTGIGELLEAVLRHQAFLQHAGRDRERRRTRSQSVFWGLLQDRLAARLMERVAGGGRLDSVIDRIASREIDPYSAVDEILREAGL